jgi:uncharacterized membrane protein YeiH
MHDLALATPLWLAVLGIVVNALVGALRGYTDEHHHWDVVGVLAFALLMGLGGGVIRDLLLGELPPSSLRTPWPLVTAVLSVALARLVGHRVAAVPGVLGALDALALGLFAMTGAAASVAHGLPLVSAVLVGVISAVGGGVLVSIVRGEVPSVLQPSRPQALLAGIVAIVYLALSPGNETAAYVTGAVVGVLVFLAAQRWGVETSRIGL